MKAPIRLLLGVAMVLAAAAGAIGVLTRSSEADFQAGSFSLEVSAAPEEAAVGSAFTLDVAIRHEGSTPYQAVQWYVDYDETMVDVGPLLPVSTVRDSAAPAQCSTATDNAARLLLGCIDIFGANLTYSGVVWRVQFTCIGPGSATFALGTATQTFVKASASVSLPVHTHEDAITCTGEALTHTPTATSTATRTSTPTYTPSPTPSNTPTPYTPATRATDTPFPCDGQPCTPTPVPAMRAMSSAECFAAFGAAQLNTCIGIREGAGSAAIGALPYLIDLAGNDDGTVSVAELHIPPRSALPQLHAGDGALAIVAVVPNDVPLVWATTVGQFNALQLILPATEFECSAHWPVTATEEDCDGDGVIGDSAVTALLVATDDLPGAIGRVTAWNALTGDVVGDVFVEVVGEPQIVDIVELDSDIVATAPTDACEVTSIDPSDLISEESTPGHALVVARSWNAEPDMVEGAWIKWTVDNPAVATLALPESPSLALGGGIGTAAVNILCSTGAEGSATVRAELVTGPIGIVLDPAANLGAFDEEVYTFASLPTHSPTPTETNTPRPTPTNTATFTHTVTPTSTVTQTDTPTPTETNTPSPAPSSTATLTPTPSGCPADVNGSGDITGTDVAAVARALGSAPGLSRWNAAADLNGDGKVSLIDLRLVIKAMHEGGCG